MAKVTSTHILAVAPTGDSAPDSITLGDGALWVEYGNGASSTGGGTSKIVEYSMQGQIEHTYTARGLADGLKYDPRTGEVWVLNNNDGNATLQLIDPATGRISSSLSYGTPYVYGSGSSRGFDDVVFDGRNVFLSETNPANPGDPVVVRLLNGNDPFGKLQTAAILSFGDQGTNLVTGKTGTLPITDPDSLKLLPDGSLLLTGEADHAYIFIRDPGTSQQTASFVVLPAGDIPDDAIMPAASSGTFYISNQGGNDIVSAHVTGLNPNDLYADITSKNELVQIDPTTGKVTVVLSGLSSPHGLAFVPDAPPPPDPVNSSGSGNGPGGASTPRVVSTHILATAPTGDSAPDSITRSPGSLWVEYGNGASGTGGGTSVIAQYTMAGRLEHTWTAQGLADGLKYDPVTGDVWALNNNDGNATLQIIDPATGQISKPLTYDAPYQYGPNSSRGFDDVVFQGQRVFLSETNPVNPGDPVVVMLQNGTAPFGSLQTQAVLSFGDQGIDIATGKLATLPVTDPDSLKMLGDGSLILTGEADHSFTFIRDPGTAAQTASFITLPGGDIPDDAIMPRATSGTFTISNQGGNDIVSATVTGLNPFDLYADITSKNELVQVDPTTGSVTTVLSGLNSPHGLAFTASSPLQAFHGNQYF